MPGKFIAAALFLTGVLARPAWSGELNVILVVMDTVRADRCSLYGYARKTTPRLEELAARGLTFETALAQSNWTGSAFASLFTGRRPLSHGVLRLRDRLAASETTLARLFEQRGFKTAAFAGFDLGRNGLRGGFGYSVDFSLVISSRAQTMGSLAQSMPAAISWLGRNSRDRLFLFVHGSDAHRPYICPKPWRDRFAAPPDAQPIARGDIEHFPQSFSRGLNPPEDWLLASPESLARARALRADARNMVRLSDLSDGCLAYGDEQLAALSAAMTRLGLWKNTVLVVTADHGEEFGDHGGYEHMFRPLHEEILRVPLMISAPASRRSAVPGAAPSRTAEHFEQIDLLPTIADVEGWPLPAGVEGRSHKAALEGGAAAPERIQYSQANGSRRGSGAPDLEALRLGNWKAVRIGSRWRLFDLAQDPRELQDLFDSKPEVFLELAAKRLALEPR